MKPLIILIFAAIFLSCDDESQFRGTEYFTIAVDASYFAGQDAWVLIHGPDGAMLESRQFAAGETLTFRAEAVPSEINVTILTTFYEWVTLKTTVTTYTSLQPHQHWTLKNPPGTDYDGLKTGEFTMLRPLNEISSVNKYPNLTDRHSSFASYMESGKNARLIKNIFHDADDLLLIVTDVDEQPRYKFFQNALPGEYSMSIEDLQRFANNALITFPPSDDIFLMMRGFEADQPIALDRGYMINYYYNYGPENVTRSTLTAGHFEWIASYLTKFRAGYADKVLGYESIGTAITTGLTVDDDFATSIENRTFDGFRLGGKDYDWYHATWSNTNNTERLNITWNVKGRSGVFPNISNALPLDITIKYPELNGAQYAFKEVTIYRGSQTYDDHVTTLLKDGTPKPFEIRYKTFY